MITLYEHPYSGNSHKVRLLLSFLRIDYKSVVIDLAKQAQKEEPFLSFNPRAEVPVLTDGKVILRDSMAILVYLAKKYDGGHDWLPTNLEDECAVLEWLAFSASWIQFGVFSARAAVSFGGLGNGMPSEFPADPEEAQIRGRKSLEILEDTLNKQNWLVGEHVSIADIACFPYIAMAPMGNISLEPYQATRNWIDRFKQLPNYRTMPGL
jgi:glutathione S-transferase